MRYSIGVQSFENMRKEGYAYVDKTDLVHKLVQGSVYFLCRPRRFGKSLLVSTLKSYFLGKKELFEGLKIGEMETEWNVHPVFHTDFNGGSYLESIDETKSIIDNELSRFESLYGKNPYNKTFATRIRYVFEQAHKQTGRRVVVLVDEYDKPLLDSMDSPLESQHREVLQVA